LILDKLIIGVRLLISLTLLFIVSTSLVLSVTLLGFFLDGFSGLNFFTLPSLPEKVSSALLPAHAKSLSKSDLKPSPLS
jgi:hypothetical protein